MKAIYLFATICLAVVFSSCNSSTSKVTSNKEYQKIPASEFAEGLLRKSKDIIILDVRTPEETSVEYIKGAAFANILNQPEFDERIALLDTNKTVYVYCKSGARAERAGEYLLTKGFDTVYNLEGGIMKWNAEKLPVEVPSAAPIRDQEMSLEQFKSLIANSKTLVMVDFHAVWCGPCKEIGKFLPDLKKEFEGAVDIIKVDVDKSRDIANEYGISELPTLTFFVDGKVDLNMIGSISEDDLRSKLQEYVK